MSRPQWVRQEDAYGCSVAVLAMITGLPYQQVKSEVGFDGSLKSSCSARQKEWLAEHGFPSDICYFKQDGGRIVCDLRDELIPQQGDYFLWLSVGGPGWRHSVLQLPDGTVLDPETPEPKRLEQCPELFMVSVVLPHFDRHTG